MPMLVNLRNIFAFDEKTSLPNTGDFSSLVFSSMITSRKHAIGLIRTYLHIYVFYRLFEKSSRHYATSVRDIRSLYVSYLLSFRQLLIHLERYCRDINNDV